MATCVMCVRCGILFAFAAIAASETACSSDPGTAGTSILVPYAALTGGMIFATGAFPGSDGYDLFWAPVPTQATIDPQPVVRLTHAPGNEWQPSVSRGGKGIVFAREDDGIYLISTSGRISRVSETNGGQFKDSLPAISIDGARVAWVREDQRRAIGGTQFHETYVMMANFDGKEAKPVSARAGVIQDAPVFDPMPTSTRLAWSEFNPTTITVEGPQSFGIWVHNFANGTGRYACQSPPVRIRDRAAPYRCFGEHLAWPLPNVIITGQDLLEVNFDGTLDTVWDHVITGISTQMFGTPDVRRSASGFFPRFPLSVSYSPRVDRMLFDGVVVPIDGDNPTLAFFSASVDGGGVWRIPLDGYKSDLDRRSTGDFLFSVATPQLVP